MHQIQKKFKEISFVLHDKRVFEEIIKGYKLEDYEKYKKGFISLVGTNGHIKFCINELGINITINYNFCGLKHIIEIMKIICSDHLMFDLKIIIDKDVDFPVNAGYLLAVASLYCADEKNKAEVYFDYGKEYS